MSIKTVPPVSSGLETFDSRFGIPRPYGFVSGLGADFEPIATVSVGSGGASSIEFTSISSAYQHLQIRGLLRSTTASSGLDDVRLRLGNSSIDTGNNYAAHQLEGNG